MAMTKEQRKAALEKEWQQMISLNPTAAGERFRAQFSMEADKRLDAITPSGKDMMPAIEADRKLVAFSKQLAEATGRRGYEIRRSFAERLGSDSLRRQYLAMKRNALPAVELPAIARQIIERIREERAAFQQPQPRIFEGEQEWQAHLAANNLVEAHGPETQTAAERRAKWQQD